MNDISELRTHLFDTLKALRDPEKPMDIDRAKAVCEVSDQIISSAKVEVDFARVNGSVDSKFFHKPELGALRLPSKPESGLGLEDEKPEAEATGSHKTETGTVAVDHRNGQRIVTHKLT